jgi:hypothetical protein
MRKLTLVSAVVFLAACAAEPGSERWCSQKADQPKSEWSGSDALTYTRNCLVDGTSVGSTEWCEGLADTPKGEWTGDEAASYAKHCVM